MMKNRKKEENRIMKNLTNKTMKEEQLINKMWEAVETIEKNILLNTTTYFRNSKNPICLSYDLERYNFTFTKVEDIENCDDFIASRIYLQRYEIALEKTHELQDLINDFRELVDPNHIVLSDDYLQLARLYIPYDNDDIHTLDNISKIIWAIKRELYSYNNQRDGSAFKLLSEREYYKYSVVIELIFATRFIPILDKIIRDTAIKFKKQFVDSIDDEDLPF
jgi:hypothetical protein